MKKNRKTIAKKILKWGTGIAVLVLFIFFHFIGPRIIIGKRNHSKKTYLPIDQFSISCDTIRIIANDGKQQEALFCHSNTETILGTVIFVHGIGGRKDHFLPKAQELANYGIQSIMIDLRAHGNSEGDYVTFGYYETKDISLFIDKLTATYTLKKIGIWGQSLGGAISLQILAKDKRIDFGIIESTYATFDNVVYDYSRRVIGVPLGFLNDYVIWRAQSIGNFDKSGIHPIDACKKITQPVLLVHGDADERISIQYAYDNFSKLQSTDKELYVVNGAKHTDVWNVGGTTYSKKCMNFIQSNL